MVDKTCVVRTFLDLVSFNTPSRKEKLAADYAVRLLSEMGFEVELDDTGHKIDGDCGNVFAYLPPTIPHARPIFLSCHLDTVEPTENIVVIEEDEDIRTDGSTILGADDKAGVAAILEGLRSIVDSGIPHGGIQVIFSVSEEIGLLGARNISKESIKGDFGFILDTEKPVAGITVSAPSHETMTIEVKGKASHAGIAPENGVNAIVAASNAISKMRLGRIDFETTANVGVISGGKARNIVPDKVIIKAEARSRDEGKLKAQSDYMKQVFIDEAEAIGAKAEINSIKEYNAFRWNPEDDVVRLAAAACRRIGIEPVYQDGGGGSDANFFNSNGIPSVVIGVGYEGAHSVSEHISKSDLLKAAEYVESLIITAADGGW